MLVLPAELPIPPPSRRHGWSTAATAAVVAAMLLTVASGAWLFATQFRYTHREAEDFELPGAYADHACGQSPMISSPRAGGLNFTWTTNNSVVGQMKLYELTGDEGPELIPYYVIAAAGSGSLATVVGDTYWFVFCGTSNQSATISGSVSYSAPWL